jgi:hypothetical protein
MTSRLSRRWQENTILHCLFFRQASAFLFLLVLILGPGISVPAHAATREQLVHRHSSAARSPELRRSGFPSHQRTLSHRAPKTALGEGRRATRTTASRSRSARQVHSVARAEAHIDRVHRSAHARLAAREFHPAAPIARAAREIPASLVERRTVTNSSASFTTGESHPPDDERLTRDAASDDDHASSETTEISAADAHAALKDSESNKLPATLSARELAEQAVQPRVLPIYDRSGHLIVPPPLRGSREILVHQNTMADAAGLERIQNDEELDRLRATRRLVDLASTQSLHVNPELPENRRCARPWTARFAADIARAYFSRFGEPLELNSAVRTISYQLRLERVNGNAAAVAGETASPHLTGQAIDFGKRGMTMAEIAWMRAYLTPLMQAGAIDVEEEFQQACFHISVYRSYVASSPSSHRLDLAQDQTGHVSAQ